ncbi:MAG: hypothetical protein DI565_19410 [Ancylobacter novellus]|uniref:Uncharacterized protein n=1 Tax=Ancylobacter novellus TaxID=921 RepID=A0A2W5K4B7_ANCNO|nr:MAG: hypothetical protein DI565_19410 [Ancylobacter novellus]
MTQWLNAARVTPRNPSTAQVHVVAAFALEFGYLMEQHLVDMTLATPDGLRLPIASRNAVIEEARCLRSGETAPKSSMIRSQRSGASAEPFRPSAHSLAIVSASAGATAPSACSASTSTLIIVSAISMRSSLRFVVEAAARMLGARGGGSIRWRRAKPATIAIFGMSVRAALYPYKVR